MIGEQRIPNYRGGNNRVLSRIISWDLPQETEKNLEKSK
jgi:hypothetical protein